jgi:hypothetical protein
MIAIPHVESINSCTLALSWRNDKNYFLVTSIVPVLFNIDHFVAKETIKQAHRQ